MTYPETTRPRWRPTGLLLLWFLLAFAPGCGRLPGKPTPAQIPLEPQQITNFVALYRENCAGCHGSHGQGNAALALSNAVYQAIVDDATLRRVIAQGAPQSLMPAFARSAGGFLTDSQVDILVRGLRANWAKPNALGGATPPPYAASTNAPGDPRRGEAVFTKFCARCHGTDGTGSGKVGSIVEGSYLALVSNQGLRTTVIAGRPERGHPDWRQCLPGEPMSAAQVSDVVAWLISKRPAWPGQPYAASPGTRD